MACGQELLQPALIVGADRMPDRRPCGERLAPSRDTGLAGQNPELTDALEHAEKAEHRPEHGIDQREVAVEPRAWSQVPLQPRELRSQRLGLRREGRLV